MFRFTNKPSSGSHSQCLAKITRFVQCWYRHRADVSAMAVLYDLCGMCVVHGIYACTVHNTGHTMPP